jgi:anti-sigma B factor antagonist
MEITKSRVASAAVLQLQGRLTMVAAPQLRAEVEQSVRDARPRVVVDLTGVEFVDSSGLGALVAGLKTARQAGGDLRIAAAGEQVQTVLGLTNLDRVLRNHRSVEDALDGW